MDLSDEPSAFDGLCKITICSFISFLSLQLNEYLQPEIKQKPSSVQKITCVTAIANKRTISVFCVSGVLCSLPQSAVQIKQFPHLVSIFSWNQKPKRKKANQQLYVN